MASMRRSVAAGNATKQRKLRAAGIRQAPFAAILADKPRRYQLRMVLRIERACASGHHPSVAPAVVDQRLGLAAVEIDHFAEEDRVVAAFVFEPSAATEARR